MELPRSSARASRRPRTAYRPPPFGFSDVRFFIDKFEAHYDTVPCSVVESSREVAKYTAEESYFDDFPFDVSASSGERVVWKILFWKLGGILSGCVPSVTLGNLGACALAAGFVAPKMITYLLLYPFCRLVFGTLYPAYASYKAVRTKNLKEYVKWMMYWIVFALFTTAETFTDVFLSWFPFYYEVKIILVLWLLSPATKGSSILYRKFVHPALSRREQEIDDAIAKAKEQGYHTVLNLGTKGVNYATAVIMQTAIRGGGGLVQQLKKSYSLSDLTESLPQVREQEMVDEADDVLTDPRLIRRNVARSGYNTRRSASESNNRTPLYFSEVDVDVRQARASQPQDFSHIKSSEDISSGYSSADNSAALKEQSLSRTGSVGASGKLRSRQVATRSTITTIKRPGAAEGSEVIIEELHDNESVDYTNLPPLLRLPPTCHISQTDPPFLFEYVGNQIKIIQILGDVSQNFVTRDHKDNEGINIPQNSNPVGSSDITVNINEKVNESTKIEIIPETPPKDLPIEIIPTNDQSTKDNVDTAVKESSVSDVLNLAKVSLLTVNEEINNETPSIHVEIKEESDKSYNINDEKVLKVELKDSNSMSSSNASLNSAETSPSTGKDDTGEANSIGTSSLNDDAVESDDEASYGTPDDSPKGKRNDKRGKYGKSKAPAPPKLKEELKIMNENKTVESEQGSTASTALDGKETNQNASPIEPKLVNSEIGSAAILTGKPTTSFAHGHISKKNRRQKSKSPVGRKSKVNSSPMSKLMQLPGKFAFWHKTDDKSKADTWSMSSSDEHSDRSSTVEKTADDFQSCIDLQEFAKTDVAKNGGPNENIPTITFSDSVGRPDKEDAMHVEPVDIGDVEEAAIAKDILDKSDALQKLIEAKLERHPEYKIVPLHGDELATTSRSTEV